MPFIDAISKIEEAWIIVPKGGITFRFGPYTKEQAGEIMAQAVEKKKAIIVVYNCGPNFNWEFAEVFADNVTFPSETSESSK